MNCTDKQTFRSRYFAAPSYYKSILLLVIPMILQAAVTNFVSLLDNIMVGQIGTAQMSGVSIINQYVFVFNLTCFGAVSGPGIFGTQFFGKKDPVGQRYTVRFRLYSAVLIIAAAMFLFTVFQSPLIHLFLSSDDSPEMIETTYRYAAEYLRVVIFSMIPFAIGQVYASTVRECGKTTVPMLASFLAVGVNLFLDYALIFGKFGLPEMGVAGAALATVIAKFLEAAVIIFWAHTHTKEIPCMPGLFREMHIPRELFREILKKSVPLLMNEFLWALGVAVVAQCYSIRGLNVVAARNIASTINNMFNVIYLQMGVGVGIVIGQLLGAGQFDEAWTRQRQLTVFSIFMAALTALILIPIAFLFPQVYNTEQSIRDLATYFILIQAAATPIWSYTNVVYFIIRSGGKTGITFLFDFGFSWCVMIPLAFVLSYYTGLGIRPVFAIVTFSEGLKMIAGWILIRSGRWVNRIVE